MEKIKYSDGTEEHFVHDAEGRLLAHFDPKRQVTRYEYDAAGLITRYECIEYPNCSGNPIGLESEDNVFRAPEYTINSAPATGEAPYTITYVDELPSIG